MGKNRKSTLVFKDELKNLDIIVDSTEEWQFFSWIVEAKKLGIVIEYSYQPAPFLLTEKAAYEPLYGNSGKKSQAKHLLAEHSYTADFKVTFNEQYGETLSRAFKLSKECINDKGHLDVYIDVKGGFNRFGGDRLLPIHQKLVWEKYRIFINKLVPKEFFMKLGCPRACRTTIKTKKISHLFDGCRFIEHEFKIEDSSRSQQCP